MALNLTNLGGERTSAQLVECLSSDQEVKFLNPRVMSQSKTLIHFLLSVQPKKTPLHNLPGRVAQSVTCLAAYTCLTLDPGLESSIPARSPAFVEIDHKIISKVILLSADSRRVVVSYKPMYVHEVLVKCLVKLGQEKSVVR